MATLVCKQFSTQYRLDLHAWYPKSGRTDMDSYRLLLYQADELIYDQTHSVAGRQDGHFTVYRMSNAFRRCELLADKTLSFNIYSTGCPHKSRWQHASLDVDTNWLSFTLYAVTRRLRGENLGEQRIIGKASLLLREVAGFEANESLIFSFYCSPQQAIDFGEELAREGRVAAQERLRKGYSKPDSFEPFIPETSNDVFVRGNNNDLSKRRLHRTKNPAKYGLA